MAFLAGAYETVVEEWKAEPTAKVVEEDLIRTTVVILLIVVVTMLALVVAVVTVAELQLNAVVVVCKLHERKGDVAIHFVIPFQSVAFACGSKSFTKVEWMGGSGKRKTQKAETTSYHDIDYLFF